MDSFIRDWSSLPQLAIFKIATRLNPIQFTAIRGVCKSWRSICTENRAAIVEKQPPLLLRIDLSWSSDPDSPVCHLYSFPDNIHYISPPLPPEFHHRCSDFQGYSHGYLIATLVHDRSALWCCNPFTGDHFSVLFPEELTIDKVTCAVFTDSPASGRCIIVVFTFRHMLYCDFRVGDGYPSWEMISFSELRDVESECVLQAVMFKGLLYCLAFGKDFAIQLHGTTPKVISGTEFPTYNGLGCVSTAKCLLANDNELLVVHLVHNPYHVDDVNKVYRLQDPEVGNWELVDDVGGRTLFASKSNGFIPCVRGLVGFEHDWDDRIFFANPFCNLPINSRIGSIWYPIDKHPFDVDEFSRKHLFSLAWVPPSLIC